MALESLENQSGNLPTEGATSQPDFDAAWYLQQNPDVAASPFASDPYAHYTMYGRNEGRLGMAPVAQTPSFGTVESLYRDVLNRQPDQPGLEYWKGQFGDTIDQTEYDQFMAAARAELANKDTSTGTGVAAPVDMTASGVPYTNIANAINQTLADPALDSKLKADKIYNVAQQYNVTQDDIAKALGIPVTQVQDYFDKAQNFVTPGLEDWYKTSLSREADPEGLKYWSSQFGTTLDPNEIAKLQGTSEYREKNIFPTSAAELSALFTKQFDTPFLSALTADEMKKFTDIYSDVTAKQKYTAPVKQNEFDREFYLQQNPDVARAGVDPYQHYLEYGFNEGRAPNATGPGAMTADQRYQEVLRQAALDPELGAIIKAKDPFLYESLTPLTSNPDQQKTTERIRYGQYGTYNVDGVDVPILNAKVADQILGRDQFGEVQDFSHGRGRALAELGWTGNSFSNKLARGAEAIGVKKYSDGEGNFGYTGLDEAARIVGLDTSKFADKQVPMLTREGFDENGNYTPGGQPVYQRDENGNVMVNWQTGEPIPQMTTLSRDQQIYDAINEAAKDIYLYTGDSLTAGKAREGGSQSFDTVLYKRSGDELIPITKPTAHGGYQNMDVYTGGSGFNFGRDIAPGLIFVGGAALAWTGAGALASQIGNFITAPIGSALGVTVPAGVSSVVGGITIGAATGALTAAATGTDIGQGAIKGGVAGGVGAAMPQVLNNLPGMGGVVNGIASSLNLNPADVSNVVSSTLSRTLATAAAGANGDQILNAFGTALASTSIGAAGANAVKSVFADSFTPSQLAGMARATQLVTNAAASSLLSGGSAEQVAGSVINSLVSGAGSIQQAADKAATAGFTKAELDAIQQGADQARSSGQSQYYAIASNITSDQPIPLVSKDSIETSLYDSKYWDPQTGSWKDVPTDGGGGGGGTATATGTAASVTQVPSAAELKREFEAGTLPSAGEINNMLANGQMSKAAADAYLSALGQYQPAAPDFSKIDDSLNLAISLTVNLVGSGANPVKTLDNVSKATGIDTRIISQAINSTKGPKGDTTTTGTAKVTGATDGSGATGATGPTGVTGVTGGGSGVTGATGGGGGGEGTGEGGGGEGTGGTGVTGGTGTGGEGTGTGGGGGGTGTGGGGGRLPTLPTIPAITAAKKVATEDVDGIYNLTPGLTRARTDYQLAGKFGMADGGTVSQYNPFGLGDYTSADAGVSDITKTPFVGSNLKMPRLTAGLTKRMLDYALPGILKFEEGGSVPGEHNPQFFSEGGLNSLENRYVTGEGDGTSDSVPAMLATGEFVIPADVVSSLGNGSNDAGAAALDEFLKVIREHKQKHDAKKLPPDSKGPLAYLLEAKKRA